MHYGLQGHHLGMSAIYLRHWHATPYLFMGICVYVVLHKYNIFSEHEFENLVRCSLKWTTMHYYFPATFDNV